MSAGVDPLREASVIHVPAGEDSGRQDNQREYARTAPDEPAYECYGETRHETHKAVDIPRQPVEPRIRSSERLHALTIARHTSLGAVWLRRREVTVAGRPNRPRLPSLCETSRLDCWRSSAHSDARSSAARSARPTRGGKTHKRCPQRRVLERLELEVARRLVSPGCVSGGEAPQRDTHGSSRGGLEPQLWLNYPAPSVGCSRGGVT